MEAEAVNSSNCKSVSIKLRGWLSPEPRPFNKSSSKPGASLAPVGDEPKSQTAIKLPSFAHYALFICKHKRSRWLSKLYNTIRKFCIDERS